MGVKDGVTVAAFCFAFALVIASAFLYENIKLINTHTCITCNKETIPLFSVFILYILSCLQCWSHCFLVATHTQTGYLALKKCMVLGRSQRAHVHCPSEC